MEQVTSAETPAIFRAKRLAEEINDTLLLAGDLSCRDLLSYPLSDLPVKKHKLGVHRLSDVGPCLLNEWPYAADKFL